MMPFKKAKPKQSYVKIGLYGAQGSGKTVTALLFAEGLAKREKKRIAYVDTEGGTDFYAKAIKKREFHPEAFDFDAVYSRSLSEVLKEVKGVDTNQYGVIVIDSITHLWEAAKASYEGRKTRQGTIPLHAWGDIKAPYKELVSILMNCKAHIIICGREGAETEDEDGSLKIVGKKMKAEGETPYEPNILIHMSQQKRSNATDGLERGDIVAYFEKDRTGLFGGTSVRFPNYATIEPLMNLLSGGEQRHIDTEDEVIHKDANLIDDKKEARLKASKDIRIEWSSKMSKATSLSELIEIVNSVPKKRMYQEDKDMMNSLYQEMKLRLDS